MFTGGYRAVIRWDCLHILGVKQDCWLHLENQPANLTPKLLPIRAGGVILFHNYTLHSAKPNESETVRWSFDLRYHDVYQPTGRPYYPAFLMRSRLRPEACQTDYETWCKRWEFALENSKGVQAYRWPW